MFLLATKRFLPLFFTQFLGAFNDNLFKSALVILITYKLGLKIALHSGLLVTLAAGLFVLPFFLFSALAGQLADKYDRARLARYIKLAEIAIVLFASFGFLFEKTYYLLTVLFIMGTHSTFFGPIKYALLPQHLSPDELLTGNAYVEAATFIAIILGTVFGGVLILQAQGVRWISIVMIFCALSGYLSSCQIPAAPAPDRNLRINPNLWTETLRILSHLKRNKRVFLAVLGISWFWFFGATYLAQFPEFTKSILRADNYVVTLCLSLFSIGIAIGSWLCQQFLKGEISTRFVPLSLLGMSLFSFDLFWVSQHALSPLTGKLWSLNTFLGQFVHWRILVDLFFISGFGGMFVVPLYTIMQKYAQTQYRARIIAANNILNALFMVFSAVWAFILIWLSFSTLAIFLSLGIFSLLLALGVKKKMLRPGSHGPAVG